MNDLIKYSPQELFLPSGEPTFRLLHPRTMEKIAGSPFTPQEILECICNLRPRDDGRYVHLIALGAGEYFGSNRNSDFFDEFGLKGDPAPPHVMDLVRRKGLPVPPEYGYKTFERYAYVYRGHANFGSDHAIGERVCCAAYNDKMHRVELIVFIYKSKAPDIIEALDAGRPVAFSMGAKLLWDQCCYCHNVARTREEYCDCLKSNPGKIMPDGRRVYAHNYFPRFFDISEIVVPADRSAYSLKKVAGARGVEMAAPVMLPELQGMAKIAGLLDYLSAGGKTASIDKEIPPAALAVSLGKSPIKPEVWSMLRTKAIQAEEESPAMPACLRQVSGQPLDKLLPLLTALGILLRPSEVDAMAGPGGEKLPSSLDFSNISPTLNSAMRDLVEKRSLFEPAFSIRVRRIVLGKPGSVGKEKKKSPAYKRYLDLLSRGADAETLKEATVQPQISALLDPACLEKEIIGLGSVGAEYVVLPFLAALDAMREE